VKRIESGVCGDATQSAGETGIVADAARCRPDHVCGGKAGSMNAAQRCAAEDEWIRDEN